MEFEKNIVIEMTSKINTITPTLCSFKNKNLGVLDEYFKFDNYGKLIPKSPILIVGFNNKRLFICDHSTGNIYGILKTDINKYVLSEWNNIIDYRTDLDDTESNPDFDVLKHFYILKRQVKKLSTGKWSTTYLYNVVTDRDFNTVDNPFNFDTNRKSKKQY